MKQIILGLDPGTRLAGFGVICVDGDRITALDHGVIRLGDSLPLGDRLLLLEKLMREIYARHKITTAVVEKIFLGKNADSAFKLGHARGVCLLVAAQHEAVVAEYAARYVKKCVTGNGSAEKQHVQMVVLNLLGIKASGKMPFDASDALALAITHARVGESEARLKRALEVEL